MIAGNRRREPIRRRNHTLSLSQVISESSNNPGLCIMHYALCTMHYALCSMFVNMLEPDNISLFAAVTPEPPKVATPTPTKKQPTIKTVTTKPPVPTAVAATASAPPKRRAEEERPKHAPHPSHPLPPPPPSTGNAASEKQASPFDYVGMFPPRTRRASIVGAVIPYPTYPNWPSNHGQLYG